uniref:Uncharacterized protein n=1 Tax=Scleropages formosus TaxID=113540 RepID=A0A8C9WEZ6_SCLFO
MRPRSRLLAKKRLPTIREGSEDCRSPGAGHQEALSSEAYLQSICQLARPAFPVREPDRDILALGSLDQLKPGVPTWPPSPVTRRYTHRDGQPGHGVGAQSLSDTGAPDPLEYLYGHRNTSSQDCQSPRTRSCCHTPSVLLFEATAPTSFRQRSLSYRRCLRDLKGPFGVDVTGSSRSNIFCVCLLEGRFYFCRIIKKKGSHTFSQLDKELERVQKSLSFS